MSVLPKKSRYFRSWGAAAPLAPPARTPMTKSAKTKQFSGLPFWKALTMMYYPKNHSHYLSKKFIFYSTASYNLNFLKTFSKELCPLLP